MSRTRIAAVAALAVLAAGAAVRTLRGPGGADRPAAPAPGAAAIAQRPPPPTPVPWADSVVAVVVPDGRGQAIDLVDPIGAAPARRLVGGLDAAEAPAWSPDGTALAFAARRDGNWDVFTVARGGGAPRRVTAHGAFDGAPAWSPDGRALAWVSHRDGALAVYRLDLAAGEAGAARVSGADGPAVDPAWSPDGRWIAYAAWHAGAYRIEAVGAAGGAPRVVAGPAGAGGAAGGAGDGGDIDLRAPAWSPDGRRLAYLRQRYGMGQVVVQAWAEPGDTDAARPAPATTTLAAQVVGYAWFPGGQAVAVTTTGRRGRGLQVRPVDGVAAGDVAVLPPGPGHVSWAAGAAPPELPAVEIAGAVPVTGAPDARPGLATLAGIEVPGARIHAGLADDFAALRADVRAATGRDFLGTLADAWRPLGFKSSGSAFFSWHKTGRAFDTQMELWGPGGRRDMVLVRDEAGGRTQWRMFLRAGAQDGSAGRPLFEPGWTFAAGSGDAGLAQAGGRRGATVPGGYWVDFTALAARYGWHRIPSIGRGRLDWRRSWTGIEYWHYERRDGLRWFEAARQVYDDAALAEALHPDRLRALDVSLGRLAGLGFPAGWPGES